MDPSTAAQQQQSTAPPPLPPELWNFVVVVLICGFVGWMMRLAQHFLTLVDVRFAVNSDAILQLKDLGPSLSVLEHASMWHFQQLLRTKVEVSSAKMTSVHLPFEIPASSLTVSRTSSRSSCTQNHHQQSNTAANAASMQFAFKIKSSTRCVAQVFWGVKTEALVDNCSHFRMASSAKSLLSPTSSRYRNGISSPIPVLRSLSAQKKSLQQRAADLPTFLSRVRRQDRRHRLNDDDKLSGGGDDRVGAWGFGLEKMVGSESFRSMSPPERYVAGGEHEYVAKMPSTGTCEPSEETQSLRAEVELDVGNPVTAGVDAASSNAPQQEEEPRYGAVVLVGSLDFFESQASELSANGSLLLQKQSNSKLPANSDHDEVICQCVAIDFLPTPGKNEKFMPVVVKKLTFTRSNVYIPQEIFETRDTTVAAAGECVICLESAIAAVLLPCRHFCVCRACLEEIDQCPICRAKFSTYACYAELTGSASASTSTASGLHEHQVELKIV